MSFREGSKSIMFRNVTLRKCRFRNLESTNIQCTVRTTHFKHENRQKNTFYSETGVSGSKQIANVRCAVRRLTFGLSPVESSGEAFRDRFWCPSTQFVQLFSLSCGFRASEEGPFTREGGDERPPRNEEYDGPAGMAPDGTIEVSAVRVHRERLNRDMYIETTPDPGLSVRLFTMAHCAYFLHSAQDCVTQAGVPVCTQCTNESEVQCVLSQRCLQTGKTQRFKFMFLFLTSTFSHLTE